MIALKELALYHSIESLISMQAAHCRAAMIVEGEEAGSYCFMEQIFRESTYQHILVNQRKKIHGILEYYYEKVQNDLVHQFDDILYHFRHSDDISIKVEYLTQAAVSARSQNNFNDNYFNLSELVVAVTGSDVKPCFSIVSKSLLWRVCKVAVETFFKGFAACLPGPSTASLPTTFSCSAHWIGSEVYVDDTDDPCFSSAISSKYLTLRDFRQKIKLRQAKDDFTTTGNNSFSNNWIDYLAEMSSIQFRYRILTLYIFENFITININHIY